MNRLWNFFQKKGKFLKVESIVIGEIKKKLKPENIRIYDDQINEVNHIERIAGRESDFFKIKCGNVENINSVFLNMDGGNLIARIFMQSEKNQNLKCEVWMVNGVVFSIEYDKNVYEFEKVVLKDHVDVKIEWLCDL